MADSRRPRTTRRPKAAASPPPFRFEEMLRSPVAALARLSGIETAARAMERLAVAADNAAEILDRLDAERLDRLATAAERAAAMLDRLEAEMGVDRVLRTLDELEKLSSTTAEMRESLRAIEAFLIDTRAVLGPLERLPIPKALRRSTRRTDSG